MFNLQLLNETGKDATKAIDTKNANANIQNSGTFLFATIVADQSCGSTLYPILMNALKRPLPDNKVFVKAFSLISIS